MVAKQVSRRKSPAKSNVVSLVPEFTESAALRVLESPPATPTIDPEMRQRLIATEAYFIAERRGFAPGHEVEDWIAAEAVVSMRLREMLAA